VGPTPGSPPWSLQRGHTIGSIVTPGTRLPDPTPITGKGQVTVPRERLA
jgi:hypothetical protein